MQYLAFSYTTKDLIKKIQTTDQFSLPEEDKINTWESSWLATTNLNSIDIFLINESGKGNSIPLKDVTWKSGSIGKRANTSAIINGIPCSVYIIINHGKTENGFIVNVSICRSQKNTFKAKDRGSALEHSELPLDESEFHENQETSINKAA